MNPPNPSLKTFFKSRVSETNLNHHTYRCLWNNTPLAQALAKQSSGRNCSLDPNLMLWKPIFQRGRGSSSPEECRFRRHRYEALCGPHVTYVLSITISYYTILYYTILYYTTIYYTILYYTIPYCTILFYTVLCYSILHHTRGVRSAATSSQWSKKRPSVRAGKSMHVWGIMYLVFII